MIARSVAGQFGLMERILASYDLVTAFGESAACSQHFHLALCASSDCERLKKMIEASCLGTPQRYPHGRMPLDTQKDDVARDHCRIVDACKRSAVDEVVSMHEQNILETKHEVPAAVRLG